MRFSTVPHPVFLNSMTMETPARYLFLILMILLLAGGRRGEAQTFLSEDWENCGSLLPEGWATVGTDKTPKGQAAEWFTAGEGWKALSTSAQSGHCAASYSSTVEGGKVETWLISPEFEIPAAGGFVHFPVWVINGGETTACKWTVRISTGGAETDAFSGPALLTNRIKPSDGKKNITVSLGGYAGRKVRLAIVNEGTQAGVLCVGDLKGEVCVMDIVNKTPLILTDGVEAVVALDMSVRALCNGFDATVTTSNGYTETKSCSNDLSEGLDNYALEFRCGIPQGECMSYTVAVTPRLEGAETVEVKGSLAVGEGYPAVCLMEEATGERCGYCPAGVAAIERYTDLYGDRFIGVGVHCFEQFSTGVMENHDYSDPFLESQQGITGLPSAVLNRRIVTNPNSYTKIDGDVSAVVDTRSAAQVRIDRVDCDRATGVTDVKFTATLCAPLDGMRINACVILTADNLVGTSRKWYQTNYFSGTTEVQFLQNADASWWQYMKFWCEYPSKAVSPSDHAFDHVAMGIYPDYYGAGCRLKEDWTSSTHETGTIGFVMPMQQETDGFGVQDVDDTAVIAVLINAADGTVIAASQVKASDYNKDLSGVGCIEDDSDCMLKFENNSIMIDLPKEKAVNVFSLDGTSLFSGKLPAGFSQLNMPAAGVLIVKIGTKAYKLICRN